MFAVCSVLETLDRKNLKSSLKQPSPIHQQQIKLKKGSTLTPTSETLVALKSIKVPVKSQK